MQQILECFQASMMLSTVHIHQVMIHQVSVMIWSISIHYWYFVYLCRTAAIMNRFLALLNSLTNFYQWWMTFRVAAVFFDLKTNRKNEISMTQILKMRSLINI